MNKRLFSQSATLGGLPLALVLLLPALASGHDGSSEHLHLTTGIALPTYGLLSVMMLVGLFALIRPRRFSWAPIALIVLCASQMTAQAHHVMDTGRNPLIGGFSLPFHGADHFLAMVAVGLFAASVTKRRWVFPVSFLAFMLVGMVMGFARLSIPLVETGIWVSVIAFGLILAVLGKMPNPIVAVLIGGFGIFHGYACGAEIPNAWSPWTFGTGVVACTIALIGVGFLMGEVVTKLGGKRGLRIAGALTAVVMAALLLLPLLSNS